jgi:hypothetical protein
VFGIFSAYESHDPPCAILSFCHEGPTIINAVTRKAMEFMIYPRQAFDPRQLQQFFQAADIRATRLK